MLIGRLEIDIAVVCSCATYDVIHRVMNPFTFETSKANMKCWRGNCIFLIGYLRKLNLSAGPGVDLAEVFKPEGEG